MKNFLKLIFFVFVFIFIFIAYSSIMFSLSKLSSDFNTIFYILLIPNFFLTMFTILKMDKIRLEKKSVIIVLSILFLLLNIRFFLFNFHYVFK